VTILQPGVRRDSGVVLLGDGDLPEFHQLLNQDPTVNAVVAARLATTRTLLPSVFGGTVLGIRSRESGALRAAAFSGGNLIPIGGQEPHWVALAQRLSNRPRICTSVVGRAPAVMTMWSVLSRVWGPERVLRAEQPLLVLDRPTRIAGDPAVRLAGPADLERYMAASAAMFTDELGVSPYSAPGVQAFRARVVELITNGRALASFDHRGQVIFKADIGVVSPTTAQVQGVWVRPDLRGRGIATGAMAAVVNYALTLAPTVSLYVNDFNAPARRVYAKLGMLPRATLATVLL